MKRYAIVRVDNMCPAITEEGINICKTDKNCKNKCPYRYGDTKEQLVMKVAQVIKRELKGDCVAGLKDTVFVMKWCAVENLAKKVIEFLGVEE